MMIAKAIRRRWFAPNIVRLEARRDIDRLKRALQHESWNIQQAAATALANLNDPEGVAFLVRTYDEITRWGDGWPKREDSWPRRRALLRLILDLDKRKGLFMHSVLLRNTFEQGAVREYAARVLCSKMDSLNDITPLFSIVALHRDVWQPFVNAVLRLRGDITGFLIDVVNRPLGARPISDDEEKLRLLNSGITIRRGSYLRVYGVDLDE